MNFRNLSSSLLVIIASLGFSCASRDSTRTVFTVQTVYDSLRNPWGMAWLPDGRMLVIERSGEILVFKDDTFTGEKLSGVPEVFNRFINLMRRKLTGYY